MLAVLGDGYRAKLLNRPEDMIPIVPLGSTSACVIWRRVPEQCCVQPLHPWMLAALKRTFTIRSNEGFVEVFAAPLVASVTAVAPKVRLHFAPKPDKDVRALREGSVDLEIGVLGKSAKAVIRLLKCLTVS